MKRRKRARDEVSSMTLARAVACGVAIVACAAATPATASSTTRVFTPTDALDRPAVDDADAVRRAFARDFTLGVGTSAYQVEGAEGGRAPSVWDAFARAKVGSARASEYARGIDFYRRYVDDIDMVASSGAKEFKMSLSWARLMREDGSVNEEGFEYYKDVVREVLARDVTPRVALFHWDAPTWLCKGNDAVTCDGAWLDKDVIVGHFERYADAVFSRLGDAVKIWTTIEDPLTLASLGYGAGVHAPGRRSVKEKMLAAHNMLIAHARAAKLYKEKYKRQRGQISIDLKAGDAEALAWFARPLVYGDYPDRMRAELGDVLPSFSEDEKAALTQSMDFFALNVGSKLKPFQLREALKSVQARYGDKEIFVTDDGVLDQGQAMDACLNDQARIEHIDGSLDALREAKEKGVNVAGYFYRAMFDDVDWVEGVSARRGLVYIDHKDDLRRYPKLSLEHYASYMRGEMVKPNLGAAIRRQSSSTADAFFVSLGDKRSGETLALRGFITAISAVFVTAVLLRSAPVVIHDDDAQRERQSLII